MRFFIFSFKFSLLILLSSCDQSPDIISKGHREAMAYECEKDPDKKLCINETRSNFLNKGYNFVTFEEIEKNQAKRMRLNCQIYKKRGLIKYNNCLEDQKELALTGSLTKNKRELIFKSNIQEKMDSVFLILVSKSLENFESGKELSQGSGVAVSKNVIATNCHVAGKNNGSFIFIFKINENIKDRLKYYTKARLIKEPRNKWLDICLLKIDDNSKKLNPVKIKKFNKLNTGEYVRAIGNPVGLVGHTSTGEINNLDDRLPPFFRVPDNKNNIKIIVHDATIGSGSSGGPLFDFKGNLIGINTWAFLGDKKAKAGGAINFAISADYIKEFLN